MGAFLSFHASVAEPFEPYVGLSLEHVEAKVLGRFLRQQRRQALPPLPASPTRAAAAAAATAPAPPPAAHVRPPGGCFGFEADFAAFHKLFNKLSVEEAV